jgi:hypothetical protein
MSDEAYERALAALEGARAECWAEGDGRSQDLEPCSEPLRFDEI